jgi:hypothetical protein
LHLNEKTNQNKELINEFKQSSSSAFSIISSSASENEDLTNKISHLNQIKTPQQNIIKSLNGVQLVKVDMYQCNYCLFQTDKKSAMNKHSRVHLPQKRKEMEESSPTSPSNQCTTSSVSSLLNKETDMTNSYCSECDIHFSSMKTFLHHRNNYCQKFKTIESIVPLEMTTKANIESTTTPPSSSFNIESSSYLKRNSVINQMETETENEFKSNPKFSENHDILLNPTNTVAVAPPGALRMGDLVYLPIYKLQNTSTTITDTLPKRNESLDVPLDLSLKTSVKKEQSSHSSILKYSNNTHPETNMFRESGVEMKSSDMLASHTLTSSNILGQFFTKADEKISYETLMRQKKSDESNQKFCVNVVEKKLQLNPLQHKPSIGVTPIGKSKTLNLD